MFAEHDVRSGAYYLQLSEAAVARTVHISDEVLVDVDELGVPVGVEFAVPVESVAREDWYALANVVPEVKETFGGFFL